MNTQLLIGAKQTPASGGKTFDRLNPITGECPSAESKPADTAASVVKRP